MGLLCGCCFDQGGCSGVHLDTHSGSRFSGSWIYLKAQLWVGTQWGWGVMQRLLLVGVYAEAWLSTCSSSGCAEKKAPVPLGFCLELSSLFAGRHGPVLGARAAAAMAASE